MTLQDSLDAIATINREHDFWLADVNSDYKDFEAKALAALDIIEQYSASVAPGVNLGRVLRFHVADSYALYVITELRDNAAYLAHVAWGDAWTFPEVEDYDGWLPLLRVKRQLERQEAVDSLTKRLARQAKKT